MSIFCSETCVLRPGHENECQDRETAIRVLAKDLQTVLGSMAPIDDSTAFDLARVALQDNIRKREAEEQS